MENRLFKRILAFVMGVVLLASNIPSAVFATDEEPPTETVAVETVAPTETTAEETSVPTEPTPTEIAEGIVTDEAMAASNAVVSGVYDNAINWSISSDGVLTVSGQGGVYPTPGGYTYPWDTYADVVTSLVFEEGIDFIQIGVFHLPNVKHLSLAASVEGMVYIGSGFLEALEIITLASGSSTYCVKDNVLFSKDMSTLFIYPCAKGETAYRIPDGVDKIRNQAFQESQYLEKLTIPSSVTYIDLLAFTGNAKLNCLIFEGDAPAEGNSFLSCFSGTVYYPANNTTWTADFMTGDFGGPITWIPYASASDLPGGKEENIASGQCGDHVTWSLDSRGKLTVSGKGAVPYPEGGMPWASHIESIYAVEVQSGVTSLPGSAFYEHTNLTEVTIADSVTDLGGNIFDGCSNLKNIVLPAEITEIPYAAFSRCTALETIRIPDKVTTIGTAAFDRCISLRNVQLSENLEVLGSSAFEDCSSLAEVILPEGVKLLQYSVFEGCTGLRNLTIPKSVTAFWQYVFDQCHDFVITFEGDAPSFHGSTFATAWNVTAYYPKDNETWTETVKQGYGGGITWVPYDDSFERHNTLKSLTDVDYLAFAQVAYEDFVFGETVQECLERQKGNKWDNVWGEENITYAELCEGIAQWKVCYIRENANNGFYAVAFQNNSGEAVLAYRGSKPLTNPVEMFTDEQSYKDWVVNDLAMILFNEDTYQNQYDDAIAAYKGTKQVNGIHTIVTTGHSLGGLWGDIASAYSGCEGITFNAISALDIMYVKHPHALGKGFRGIDAWNFTDHINGYDILAGAMEAVSSVLGMSIKLKPFQAYATNYSATSFIDNHSLKSLVSRSGDKLVLNQYIGSWEGTSGVSGHLTSTKISIDMGISDKDSFDKGLRLDDRRSSFGGDGDDTILGSIYGDTIVGGRGSDTLDGGWGDDTYYYFKGDGCDTIIDTSGQDELRLEGFSDDDLIELYEDQNSDYIEIRYGTSTIVRIYKKNRDYSVASLSSFKVYINGGQENNITEFFNKYKSGCRLLVRCPVSVEILDADGNMVYTLADGVVGSYYTDYGNFYAFEEEDGSYGKVLDLAEGYTARIVGNDTGTMKIENRDVVDGELAEAQNFVDISVNAKFTAVLEKTMTGDLLLAADTDGDGDVDSKLGYDGKPVPIESFKMAEEYVVLQRGRQTQLHAVVFPMELAEFLRWTVEAGSEDIIGIAPDGTVTGANVGTGYVLATVENGAVCETVRCRVDVAEAVISEDTQTGATVENVEIKGVQLSATTLTTELFSTKYTQFEILLQLPQNYPTDEAMMTISRPATMARAAGGGLVIEDAYFTNKEMDKFFSLVVLDDRTVRIIPKIEDFDDPAAAKKAYESVKSKYTGTIMVTVQGKDYETEPVTLNVKKTLPSLKASIPAFNSFYSNQSQEIVITGGTAMEIYENESKNTTKTTAIPTWITLEDGILTLTDDAPLASKSGSAYLVVKTEEWSIPAAITLSVKNTYKAPSLKLSTSSVTMTTLTAESEGTALKLLCGSKNDTLAGLNVVGITANKNFSVENFNVGDGSFLLRAPEGFTAGPVELTVHFDDAITKVSSKLKLNVKVANVALKLAKTSLTLNKQASDHAEIALTATPADFKLENPEIRITGNAVVNGKKQTVDKTNSGELDVSYANGKLYVSTTVDTPDKDTYKVYIKAGGSKEVTLTVSVISAKPSVTYKVSGSIDLTFPEKSATVTSAFKNYNGGVKKYEYTVEELKGKTVVNSNISSAFAVERDGKNFYIHCVNESAVNTSNTYRVTLRLILTDGTPVYNTISLKLKRTAVSLKLSASTLMLNKSVSELGEVKLTCSTKGYTLTDPVIQVMDSTGKNNASDKLEVTYQDGKLKVRQTNTGYGDTYKVLVKANANAPTVTLTVKILKETGSAITVTLSSKGSIDVIRDGSAVTLTPTYKNITDRSMLTEYLVFYKTANKVTTDVTDQFDCTRNANGTYTVTRKADAELDHSAKYTVKLETRTKNGDLKVCETKTAASVSVKMGSAKMSVASADTTLFAKDKNDRVVFRIDTTDSTLNGIHDVTVKESDKFEVVSYGDGIYALAFKNGKVHSSLIATGKATSKAVTVTLNVTLEGNETTKTNASLKLKLTVIK